jgi:DNA-binding MarR family transcriptional regulator
LRDETDQRRVLIHLTPHGEQVLRRLSLLHRHQLESAGPAFVRALRVLIAGDTDTAEASQARTNVPQNHLEE